MRRILFVSAHFPSLKSKYAGHKTAFQNIINYDADSQVDLIVTSNSNEYIDINELNLSNTKLIIFEPLTVFKKIKNIIFSHHFFPMKVMSRYSKDIINYICTNLADYDLIHFEFTHSALPILFLAKNSKYKNNIVISSHDILIQGKLRSNKKNLIARLVDGVDIIATFCFESKIYKLADTILVQSHKDKKILESMYLVPASKIKVINPYFSDFVQHVFKMRSRDNIQARSLLFWGAMNRNENEEAVLVFLQKFGQRLKEAGYTLFVVGNAPSDKLKMLASDYVVVTGFLEDPSQFFLKAELGVVPLLTGAGIKVKTLEMLRAGIPVVSTPVGAEGVENPNLHVVELDQFMEKIETLVITGEHKA